MTAAPGLLERPPSTDADPPPTWTADAARSDPVDDVDLDALARSMLATAQGRPVACRASSRLPRRADGLQERTVVALMQHQQLDDHACSSGAVLRILHGRVVLALESSRTLLQRGDTVVVPATPHFVQAVGDAVVLITIPVDLRGGSLRPFVA